MPIVLAPVGHKVRIVAMSLDEEVKKHLTDMGVAIGSEVEVISNAGGSVVLDVLGARVALNREVAMKIRVA